MLKQALLVAALAATPAAQAQTGTLVFGLPVGGKLHPAPRVCTLDEVGSQTLKTLCWVSKPFVSRTGDRLGSLQLPNPDSRPEWAAYAAFEASLAKDGTLHWLAVKVRQGSLKNTIAHSLSQRFGLPEQTTLPQASYAQAHWRSEGIGIHQWCTPDTCEVRFLSAAALEEAEAERRAAELRKAGRPVSP